MKLATKRLKGNKTVTISQNSNGENFLSHNPWGIPLETAWLAKCIASNDLTGFPPMAREILGRSEYKFSRVWAKNGIKVSGTQKSWLLLFQVTNHVYRLVDQEIKQWEK